METLIDKINRFENTTQNTVNDFNEVFTDTPLPQFMPNLIVEIGEIAQPVTTRYITVDGIQFKHSFAKRTESENSND